MSETNTVPASSLAAEFENVYSEIKELQEKVTFQDEILDILVHQIKTLRNRVEPETLTHDETGSCSGICSCHN